MNIPDNFNGCILCIEKSFLSFEKGDLIVLTEGTGQELSSLGWSFGKCARTQKKGDFPTDSVHVLPTIAQPSPDLQVNLMCSLYISN